MIEMSAKVFRMSWSHASIIVPEIMMINVYVNDEISAMVFKMSSSHASIPEFRHAHG